MRKIIILLALTLYTTMMYAQGYSSKNWSIVPRIGLNFSNLGDMSVWHQQREETPKTLTDIVAGAEFDYYVHPAIEVGIGAFYSRQGCHYKDYSDTYSTNKPNIIKVDGVENSNVHLQYLNIPVTGKFHLDDNIAIKAGVQCGILLNGKWENDYTEIEVVDGISQNATVNHIDDDIKWMCRKTVWSMPIGIEFEYEHVLFGATYAIPLTGFSKTVGQDSGTPTKLSKGSNRVLTFSVGYRF